MVSTSFNLFIGILILARLVSGIKQQPENESSTSVSSSQSSSFTLPEFLLYRQKQIECNDKNCLNEKYNIKTAIPYETLLSNMQDYDWTRNNIDIDQKILKKRGDTAFDELQVQHSASPCACDTKYDLIDLGHLHFPRYLASAVCQNPSVNSRKCWRGSKCREIPYKVRVLTPRFETIEEDTLKYFVPEPLRDAWQSKTITVYAACQCSS